MGSAAAKERFEAGGAGWLDGRRLKLRTADLIVDSDAVVPLGSGRWERAVRVLAGKAVRAVTIDARGEAARGGGAADRASAGHARSVLGCRAGVEADLARGRHGRGTGARNRSAGRVVVGCAGRGRTGLGALPDYLVATDTQLRLGELARLPDDLPRRAAVAPSPLATAASGSGPDAVAVIAALVLATDSGRGTEIVENWDGHHVWN